MGPDATRGSSGIPNSFANRDTMLRPQCPRPTSPAPLRNVRARRPRRLCAQCPRPTSPAPLRTMSAPDVPGAFAQCPRPTSPAPLRIKERSPERLLLVQSGVASPALPLRDRTSCCHGDHSHRQTHRIAASSRASPLRTSAATPHRSLARCVSSRVSSWTSASPPPSRHRHIRMRQLL